MTARRRRSRGWTRSRLTGAAGGAAPATTEEACRRFRTDPARARPARRPRRPRRGLLRRAHRPRAAELRDHRHAGCATTPRWSVALASVKQAAAEANRELGLLPVPLADAIVAACREIREGRLHDQFVVDLIQGGAGTSTNMNANEVIANRALELLGHARGLRHLHPLDHVNARRAPTTSTRPPSSSPCTWPSSGCSRRWTSCASAFAAKAEEFADVLKLGRTQLQDAVPMTLGQEFGAYAVMLGEDQDRLAEATALLCEINLGATAIGTGINADPRYAGTVRARLSAITGLAARSPPRTWSRPRRRRRLRPALRRAEADRGQALQDLQRPAAALLGPDGRAWRDQPAAVQAGSSIMPGKVNPVIPRWSTRSPSRSSATTSPSPSPPRPASCSSTPSNRSSSRR